MATEIANPAVNGDDQYVFNGTFQDNNFLYGGDFEGDALTSSVRFPGVDVPQGATITSASISLQATQDSFGVTNGSPTLKVRGVDEDNFVAPTTFAEFGADPLTTAGIDWDFASAVSGTQTSPNIASVIQEIIDRVGWVSGNALGIRILNDASTISHAQTWISFNNGGTITLTIVYTAGEEKVPITRVIVGRISNSRRVQQVFA